jgi:hypothetical protein
MEHLGAENMYGVVLWSNDESTKAVIWCEDQGDLAFYAHGTQEDAFQLDAGDMVQFDVRNDRHLRFALNPRLVGAGVCAGIADSLGGVGTSPAHGHAAPPLPRQSAEIISLSAMRDRQRGQDVRIEQLAAAR